MHCCRFPLPIKLRPWVRLLNTHAFAIPFKRKAIPVFARFLNFTLYGKYVGELHPRTPLPVLSQLLLSGAGRRNSSPTADRLLRGADIGLLGVLYDLLEKWEKILEDRNVLIHPVDLLPPV